MSHIIIVARSCVWALWQLRFHVCTAFFTRTEGPPPIRGLRVRRHSKRAGIAETLKGSRAHWFYRQRSLEGSTVPDDITTFIQLQLALCTQRKPATEHFAEQRNNRMGRGKFWRKIRNHRFGIINFDAELEWRIFRVLTAMSAWMWSICKLIFIACGIYNACKFSMCTTSGSWSPHHQTVACIHYWVLGTCMTKEELPY